jgi:general secretion pathway protein I
MTARRTNAKRRGFTLMEVMVAVAILALALTAIFSSEAGAIKAAHRARRTGIATLLARCKMNEVEEQVLKEGLPAIDDMGSDSCCVDGEVEGFRCEWEIKRIVLPDDIFNNSLDDEGDGPLDSLAQQFGGTAEGSATDAPSGLDLTGAIGSSAGGPVMDMLAGGPGDALAEMAIQFTYPILKPSFEEQIRRATVRVIWNEGTQVKDFEVVQFLVAEQPPKMQGQDEAINQALSGQGTQGGSGTTPGQGGTSPGQGSRTSPQPQAPGRPGGGPGTL